jgi:hypothetical protein
LPDEFDWVYLEPKARTAPSMQGDKYGERSAQLFG